MFKIFEIMKNPSYLGAFLQYGLPPKTVADLGIIIPDGAVLCAPHAG